MQLRHVLCSNLKTTDQYGSDSSAIGPCPCQPCKITFDINYHEEIKFGQTSGLWSVVT